VNFLHASIARWSAGRLLALCAFAAATGSCAANPAIVCQRMRPSAQSQVRTGASSGGRYCLVLDVDDVAASVNLNLRLSGRPTTPDAAPEGDDEPSPPVTAGAAAGPVSYTASVAPANATFVDACAAPGAQRVLANVDDSTENIPGAGAPAIPFAMRVWGQSVGPTFTVSSNGWLSFMPGAELGNLSGTVPSPAAPNLLVAAYWTDLVTRNGICYATVGSAPNRMFVVEWEDVMEFGGGSTGAHATFEIIVREVPRGRTNNIIDVIYQRLDGMQRGAPGAGIENADGTQAAAIPPPFVPRAMRLTPSVP